MIALMGSWFPKKNRGFIVGLWATCNNFGNIAGIQVAAWLLDVFDGEWQWLQVVAGVTSIIIFFVVFFFLVPDPESIGIFVEEMTEKEQLIVTATDKDVFENVIRPSRHSLAIKPEEVIK
jgi:sugar phosphate permease